MTEYLFENEAESTLNGAVGGSDSTITIQSADASNFPSPTGSEAFYVLVKGGGYSAFMLCTSRSSAVLTVTRTDSYSFPDGSTVKLVVNATVLGSFLQKGVYRTNAGSPDGSLAAEYAGEEVLDTTNNIWYKHCTGTTWKAMSGT